MISFSNRNIEVSSFPHRLPPVQKGVGLTLSYSNFSPNSEMVHNHKKVYGSFLIEQMKQKDRIKEEQKRLRHLLDKEEEAKLTRERREIELKRLQEEQERLYYQQKISKEDNEKNRNKTLIEAIRNQRYRYVFFKRYKTYDENVYEILRLMQYLDNALYHKDLMKLIGGIKNKLYCDSSLIYKTLSKAQRENRLAMSFKKDLEEEMKRLRLSLNDTQKKQKIYSDLIANSSQSPNDNPINNTLPYLNESLIIPDACIAKSFETKIVKGLNRDNDDIDQLNDDFNLESINDRNRLRSEEIDQIEERELYC